MKFQSKKHWLLAFLCVTAGCFPSSPQQKPKAGTAPAVGEKTADAAETASNLADVTVEELYGMLVGGDFDAADVELRRRGATVVPVLLEQILAPKTILSPDHISAKTAAEEIIVHYGAAAIPAIEQSLEKLVMIEISDEFLVIPETENQYSGSSHAFAMETLNQIAERVVDSLNK